ncbi:MAG TPA: IS30 family transposase [Burkholderiales bacterium]|nr:IS30 family transposase [Burkholderiales bacterium]
MRDYTQLACEERYQIYSLLKAGHRPSEIARLIKRHKSTVSRELRRNRGQRGYRPALAQRLAVDRRAHCAGNARRFGTRHWRLVQRLIQWQWSPEQIAGRLDLLKRFSISPERIYRYVLVDKKAGGSLYRHLRCQRIRKKRYGCPSRQGQWPDRLSIEQRPAIVDRRARIGDWELDTVFGKGHGRCLLSMNDRRSRLTLLSKLPRRCPRKLARAGIRLLRRLKRKVHTLTADRGGEFALHKLIAKALKAKFYFAHAYAAWERGTNENSNGLLRQYLPKGKDFAAVSSAMLRFVMNRLNHRPRKCLGWRTPYEVFFNLKPVAL